MPSRIQENPEIRWPGLCDEFGTAEHRRYRVHKRQGRLQAQTVGASCVIGDYEEEELFEARSIKCSEGRSLEM